MQKKIAGNRVVKTCKWEFNADARTVFLLLCPTKELDWIDGWDEIHQLVYSESGIAEDACIFTTRHPEEGFTVWLTSKYSQENTLIEFVKHLTEKEVIVRWTMEVRALTNRSCAVFIIYNATGLSECGNEYLKTDLEQQFNAHMARLEELIRYYLATGTMKKTQS